MSTKKLFYAALGAGDYAMEKARKGPWTLDLRKVRSEFPKSVTRVKAGFEQTANRTLKQLSGRYEVFAARGQKTFKSIRNASPTQKAVAQTKTARTQTKAAVTSARKAAEAAIDATKEAATKVG